MKLRSTSGMYAASTSIARVVDLSLLQLFHQCLQPCCLRLLRCWVCSAVASCFPPRCARRCGRCFRLRLQSGVCVLVCVCVCVCVRARARVQSNLLKLNVTACARVITVCVLSCARLENIAMIILGLTQTRVATDLPLPQAGARDRGPGPH